MPSLLWVRRDLRRRDNPALNEAAADGPVLPLFVLDPRLWDASGDVRRAWLLRSLRSLDASFDGALVVRSGDPRTVVPAVAAEVGADRVHVAADFGPYGAARDAEVEQRLEADSRALVRTGSPYAVAPGRVRKGDGTAYRVYTPFFKAWAAHGWRAPAPDVEVAWLRDVRSDELPSEPALLDEARQAADQAIALDDGSTAVLGFAGCALSDLGQCERGEEILLRALEIDPSNAQAHVALGATYGQMGRSEQAVDRMRYGMRISPRDRRLGFWGWALGILLLKLGRPDDALYEVRASTGRDPRLHLSRILEAAVLMALAREPEARAALAAARRIRPSLSPQEVVQTHGRRIASRLEPLWREA